MTVPFLRGLSDFPPLKPDLWPLNKAREITFDLELILPFSPLAQPLPTFPQGPNPLKLKTPEHFRQREHHLHERKVLRNTLSRSHRKWSITLWYLSDSLLLLKLVFRSVADPAFEVPSIWIGKGLGSMMERENSCSDVETCWNDLTVNYTTSCFGLTP